MGGFSFRRLLLGLAAGLLSAVITLILTYLVGVVVIFIQSRDVLTTLLAAGSVLLIMVLVVAMIPTMIMGGTIGLSLALASHITGRRLGFIVGGLFGIVLAEVVISVVLPLVFKSQSGDFVDLIRKPWLSGMYGLVLGAVSGLLFRWMNST